LAIFSDLSVIGLSDRNEKTESIQAGNQNQQHGNVGSLERIRFKTGAKKT
jgi:hypothetical protein